MDRTRIREAYGKLPLSFERNQGQTDPQVHFLSRGLGYGLFLTATEAVMRLGKEDQAAVVHMQLLGADAGAVATGLGELPGRSNYFIGGDRARWRRGISHFEKVRYQGVYPGIDLLYHGNQRQLEYDFVVAPGADTGRIALHFGGAEQVSVEADGELLVQAKGGKVRWHRPAVYQEEGGHKRWIASHYVKRGERDIGFHVGAYDAGRALVIDPVLAYSTYLGGSGDDNGAGIAVDGSGNAYVTGETTSVDFPQTGAPPGGGADAFVTKISAGGTALVYSTYLGGSGNDFGTGIAVDSAGNASVTGTTYSADFPVVRARQAGAGGSGTADAFVAKLSASGAALVYATYLGGSDDDFGLGIALDGAGNAYVTGYTYSTDFPLASARQPAGAGGGTADAFVTGLSADGSAYLYSTYLGGSSDDFGTGIAVDGPGNAYVTGYTSSTDFPLANAQQGIFAGGSTDAFVAQLATGGANLLYSTYLGGSNDDFGTGIAVDGSGNAYVTGYTFSFDFPLVFAQQPFFGGGSVDAFAAQLTTGGASLLYSTFLGGSGDDFGSGIAVDHAGNASLTGTTSSMDFPLVRPLQMTFGGGNSDAFVTRLAVGSVLYSTYLGGSVSEIGNGIAVDGAGNAYVAGVTSSADYPLANPQQPIFGGGTSDAFVSQILVAPSTVATLSPPANAAGWNNSTVTVTLTATDNSGTGIQQITYSTSGAQTVPPTTVSGASASFAISTEGITTVTFSAQDNAGDTEPARTLTVRLDETPPRLTLSGNKTEATGPAGATVRYSALAFDAQSGPVTPLCTPPSGGMFPLGSTTVSCSATDLAGNTATGTLLVSVVDTTPPRITVGSPPATFHPGAPGQQVLSAYNVTATDLVSGQVTPNCRPAPGSSFASGSSFTASCSASDGQHNTASKSFRVTVPVP